MRPEGPFAEWVAEQTSAEKTQIINNTTEARQFLEGVLDQLGKTEQMDYHPDLHKLVASFDIPYEIGRELLSPPVSDLLDRVFFRSFQKPSVYRIYISRSVEKVSRQLDEFFTGSRDNSDDLYRMEVKSTKPDQGGIVAHLGPTFSLFGITSSNGEAHRYADFANHPRLASEAVLMIARDITSESILELAQMNQQPKWGVGHPRNENSV